MASKVVQITFSEVEYSELESQAKGEGLSVAQYIKNKVLPDTDFKRYFKQLIEVVSTFQPNHEFNVRSIFSEEWRTMDVGLRMALGRAFYYFVNSGKLSNVVAKPSKDSAGVQWYTVN